MSSPFPPPSNIEDPKVQIVAKLIASIIGLGASVLIYSVLMQGILEIIRETGASVWELRFIDLVKINALVIAIRVWDGSFVSQRES